jgi:AraC-like DNA-binding protein
VNRKRVECAQAALLKPQERITEIAFEVGYKSLSQFNRSFLKYAGEFRKRMKASPGQDTSVVAC